MDGATGGLSAREGVTRADKPPVAPDPTGRFSLTNCLGPIPLHEKESGPKKRRKACGKRKLGRVLDLPTPGAIPTWTARLNPLLIGHLRGDLLLVQRYCV